MDHGWCKVIDFFPLTSRSDRQVIDLHPRRHKTFNRQPLLLRMNWIEGDNFCSFSCLNQSFFHSEKWRMKLGCVALQMWPRREKKDILLLLSFFFSTEKWHSFSFSLHSRKRIENISNLYHLSRETMTSLPTLANEQTKHRIVWMREQ